MKLIIQQKGIFYDFEYALRRACAGGNFKIIKLMISKGANNFNDGLHRACLYNKLRVAKFMIRKGADDFQVSLEGACSGGHIKIVKFLLSHGANPKKLIQTEKNKYFVKVYIEYLTEKNIVSGYQIRITKSILLKDLRNKLQKYTTYAN